MLAAAITSNSILPVPLSQPQTDGRVTWLKRTLRGIVAGSQTFDCLFSCNHADAASALIQIAEHGEGSEGVGSSEVIAMSTHGRGGLERLIMGSVTHRVLETTKLPMLVIKPVQLPMGLA